MSRKNIVIIHYNTPELTECLIKSINKYVKDAFIYIFDNSDKKPFTAKFDNLILLDNTKGQIINFDSWLEKYPRKNISPGRVNKWGSAKHCYSVEKCMDIINDKFVLIDSDTLLKKDISNLYVDSNIYVGQAIMQPNSSIKRVLPFLCYINTPMCKQNNVHYFNDNYMHGLANITTNKLADSYDTGAGFYLYACKYKHTNINLDEYITHFGHGSWNKIGEKKTETPEEWLEANKTYWNKEENKTTALVKHINKKVVYTCITGGYDTLIEPQVVTNGFDYVCFTDNPNLKSKIWQIREMPIETSGLTAVKKQRYVKINVHKVLKEYDISIWVDGNVKLCGNLNKLLSMYIKNDETSVFVPKHPKRNCIYDEAKIVLAMKKDIKDNVNPQIERYKKENFPKNYGLLQSNILLRKHNDPQCIRLMEAWFRQVEKGSHRDQLSFNYALWRNKDIDITYMDKTICNSEWFKWNGGHLKNKTTKLNKLPQKLKSSSITNRALYSNRENFLKKIESIKSKNNFKVMELYSSY